MTPTRADQAELVREGNAAETRPVVAFALFAVVALTLLFLFSTQLGGISFADRDLIDTDGYMRYLRIEALLDGGEWFDPVFERSNHPFGETSHWTRLLDVYVGGIALLLTPFLGADALYWAAVVNGPLVFVAIGAAVFWAFRLYLPPQVGVIVMPATLAMPVIFLYTNPGRVDHHGAILVALVAVVGWVIRGVTVPTRRAAVWLGVCLGLGMWLSVEFLVAVALTALTLGVCAVRREGPEVARFAAGTFFIAALTMVAAVLVERGGGWPLVEVDRISVAHAALAASIAAVFAVFARISARLSGDLARWGLLAGAATGGLGLLLLGFPQLLSGPFGMVDPEVRDIWLFGVAELQSVIEYGRGPEWPAMVIAPIVLGLAAGAFQIRQGRRFAGLLTGWLLAYAVLAFLQVRWALFAHLLVLPLVVTALSPVYDWLGRRREAVILRPIFLVVAVLVVPTAVVLFSTGPVDGPDCVLDSTIPTLVAQPRTAVLASQDMGPEILYRTPHNVIATPYHRNEEGILFVRRAMSMTPEMARSALAGRSVGMVLLCPGRDDLTRPVDTTGTLYQSLVDGPLPGYASPISLPSDTDLLLFRLDP